MKNEREKILKRIITGEENLFELKNQIKRFDWDVGKPIVVINNDDLRNIIARGVNDDEFLQKIEEWANIIESREDIDFENEVIENMIFKLANPVLYGKISKVKLLEMLSSLDYDSNVLD